MKMILFIGAAAMVACSSAFAPVPAIRIQAAGPLFSTKSEKFITYKALDTNGNVLDDEYKLELSRVAEDTGNYILHRDVLRHHQNLRQASANTKTRAEVRGGGRKPWKQKGTGRARAGSSRSPLWRGGGVIFGPKPGKRTLKMNRKERNLALQTLIYNKRDSILIVDDVEKFMEAPKTKTFYDMCKKVGVNLDNTKALLVVSKKSDPLKKSTRNIPNLELLQARSLNTLSMLKAKQIMLSPDAVKDIQEIHCKKKKAAATA